MIFDSAIDAQTVGAPIIRLFVTALGRKPDLPSLTDLVARARAGASLAGLAGDITGRAEFLARHGPAGPPDQHYIRSLFWAIDGAETADADIARMLAQPGSSRVSLLLEASRSPRALAGLDLIANLYPQGLPPDDTVAYQLWLEAAQDELDTSGADQMAAIVSHAATLPPATFSLILHVPPARADLVEETLASLSAQVWPHWECLLVCPPGLPPHVRTRVQALAARVAAVRLIDAPAGASWADGANQALAEATGGMAGFLDASDRLAATALYEAAVVLEADPQALLIYSDEDWIAGDGARFNPSLKPDWSPDLCLAGDSFGQLSLYNREAVLAQGGLSANAAPFERYDLALRLAQDAPRPRIHHVPAIMFHRGRLRPQRPAGFPQVRATPAHPVLSQIVAGHLQRQDGGLTLAEQAQGGRFWPTLTAALPNPAPRVSVIVPIRDRAALLERCLQGVLEQTEYPDLEILIIDNGSREGDTLHLLQRARHDPRVRVLQQPGPFNWSALNNAGAAEATGEILLLLNNDIEVVEPGWLAAMAGHAMRPGIGAVGARLVFPNGRLQHGGVLLGPKGQAVHAMTHAAETEPGYLGQVSLPRDLSAVTGACLAIRRQVFEQVGGLEAEQLRVAWSDIDLCLRVREAGYRVLWLPSAVLIHHEAATRGHDTSVEQQARHEVERAHMRLRWPLETHEDPFLNPNLDATATAIVLAQPSRRRPPWAPAYPDTQP